MSKKGGSVHKKRFNASKIMVLEKRKGHKWIIGTKAGPHNKDQSAPISVILRDLLKIVKTNKETKKLIRDKKILIDGKPAKDYRLTVGLMDVISLPDQGKNYRLYLDKYRKLRAKEIDNEKAKIKLGKVVKKTKGKKDKIIITLHDGKTIIGDNNIKTGDSLIISLEKNKINKILKLENGVKCYIMKGKHTGQIGELKEIVQTESSKQKIVKLDVEGKEIITVAEYLFIVDDNWVNE